MFGLFDGRTTAQEDERLLLISTSIQSGLSLSAAIRLATLENRKADRAFLRLADLLDEGKTPLEAVRQAGLRRDVSDVLTKSLTNARFPEAFAFQCRLLQNRRRIFMKLANITAYPLFLLITTGIIFQLLFTFIVPNVGVIFKNFELELPPWIQALLATSDAIARGGAAIAFVFFLLILFLLQKTIFPRLWFHIPIFGTIRRLLFLSSFFQSTAFLLNQGVPYSEILSNEEKAVKNRAFKNDLRLAAKEANQGRSLVDLVLAFSWLYPLWLVPLLASCRSVEDQANAFRQAASTVDMQTNGLILLLQFSVLFCALSVVVCLTGIVVVSIFFPIVRLVASLSSF